MAGATLDALQEQRGWRLGSLADYLRLGRVQTAAMTVPTAIIPYYLATGQFDAMTWVWVLWAFAVHYCGLATNNLMDLPFDKQDPNKQLFPLVSGALSERQGWAANVVAHVLAVGIPIAVAPHSSNVIGWTLAGLAGGWAYCLTCKIHAWSLLWHHVFMAGLVLVPFLAYHAEPSMPVLAFLVIMELILTYQLMVEGPSKDAGVRQTPYDWSKLRKGTRLGIALSLRVATVLACFWLLTALLGGLEHVAALPVAVFGVLAIGIAVPTALRPASLKLFSVNEVAIFTCMVAATLPVLGAQNAVLLVLVPLLWYVACNRALWGRWGAPKI
ncbi:MAG: UbiA family prenyltransferase [Halobacteriales archaeon]|nr:UbiA family prenyltransferase [Halobacteriales archaeon]